MRWMGPGMIRQIRMADPSKNIRFVLVRPARSGNIGAAARALKNMGFSRLVLVRPEANALDSDAYRMAYGANDVLEAARIFDSLAKAVARCHLVVGTTARIHKGYGRPTLLADAMGEISTSARTRRVAIVFGPEASGLTNDEIALCRTLVTIPTDPRQPSLNLAQAVMIGAYELRRHLTDRRPIRKEPESAKPRPATSAQRERFHGELDQLLTQVGFLKGAQGRSITADLRRIMGRSNPDERELRILRGVVRQIRWALDLQRGKPH